jgi:hypothetical protein
MSIIDSIKTTLKEDLKVAESDAQEIAKAMIGAGEQTFTSIVDAVIQKAKGISLAEMLDGAFKIYQQLRADTKAAPAAPPG